MKIYNPTYNSSTNTIIAYLLPEPKLDIQCVCDRPTTMCSDHYSFENSKIQISVDDELREFVENYLILKGASNINLIFDISLITDRIESIEIKQSLYNSHKPKLIDSKYTAKLKQVDKVEDNFIESIRLEDMFKFIKWLNNNYTLIGRQYVHNNWNGDMETIEGFHVKELYEIFKNK